jgi:putative FmdB family regulatory protein
MPTYVYECAKCGDELEVWQSFTDDPLKRHTGGCGGKLAKVIQPAGIVLKGSGFYKNDSRSGSKRSSGDGASSGDSTSTEKSGTSEKPSTSEKPGSSEKSGTSDAKPDSTSGAKPGTKADRASKSPERPKSGSGASTR